MEIALGLDSVAELWVVPRIPPILAIELAVEADGLWPRSGEVVMGTDSRRGRGKAETESFDDGDATGSLNPCRFVDDILSIVGLIQGNA